MIKCCFNVYFSNKSGGVVYNMQTFFPVNIMVAALLGRSPYKFPKTNHPSLPHKMRPYDTNHHTPQNPSALNFQYQVLQPLYTCVIHRLSSPWNSKDTNIATK